MSHTLRGTPAPEEGEWRDRVKEMLVSPTRWPLWPSLPMKRRYREGETVGVEAGFTVTADFPLIVLRGMASPSGIVHQLAVEDDEFTPSPWYKEAVVARYETVDELLDDGWTVD